MSHEIALHAYNATHTHTDAVRFDVETAGGDPLTVTRSGIGDIVALPDSSGPLDLVVRMTPTSPLYWPVEGRFRVESSGVITPDANNDPTAFAPPFGAYHTASSRLTFLSAYVTRLRDRTDFARERLDPSQNYAPHVDSTPTGDNTWVPSWQVDPAQSIRVLDDVDYTHERRPRFSAQTVSPDTEVRVLEVAGPPPQVPQVLAVAWPARLSRAEGEHSPPFLTFFHANYGQNVRDGFYRISHRHPYPYGWDFLFFGLWRYLFYMGDPVTDDPYAKGLVYQIEASGKPVVLVLPVHHPGAEVGQLGRANFMEEMLLEIQAYMFRRARNYAWPGALRRAALAGFSASNGLIESFIGRSAHLRPRSEFFRSTLKEIYSFDCPDGTKGGLASSLRQWLTTGDTDKMVRLYAQNDHPAFHALVAPHGRRTGCLLQSPDASRSMMVAGTSQWPDAHTYFGWRPDPWGTVHQLIPATLLVDALRRGMP